MELSQAYEVYTGERHGELLDIGIGDRWLYVTPMFHIDAVYIFSILLHTGAALALAPNFSRLAFLARRGEFRARNYLCYVGSILAILLKGNGPDAAHTTSIGSRRRGNGWPQMEAVRAAVRHRGP